MLSLRIESERFDTVPLNVATQAGPLQSRPETDTAVDCQVSYRICKISESPAIS